MAKEHIAAEIIASGQYDVVKITDSIEFDEVISVQ